MIDITCLSDLHGHYPDLEGGDLLIVAGDLTAEDKFEQHADFKKWLYAQNYRKKIVIAGNHDNYFVEFVSDPFIFSSYNIETGEQASYSDYLCDSGTEFEGLKIWGSPWTLNFTGQNPKCKAFGLDTEEELKEKWDLIPNDIDILITHSPPLGILDKTAKNEYVGSKTLREKVFQIRPKLHVFGHIHECGGKSFETTLETKFINASHVNERYNPLNDPVRVIL